MASRVGGPSTCRDCGAGCVASRGLLLAGCGMARPTLDVAAVAHDHRLRIDRRTAAGPIPQDWSRLLSEEAKSRELAVVTRDSPAQFRARGYASAQVRGKRTVIAWVWDVYDARQQRAIRISGEETSAAKPRGWAAADDRDAPKHRPGKPDQLAGFPGQSRDSLAGTPPERVPSAGTVGAPRPSPVPRPPHDRVPTGAANRAWSSLRLHAEPANRTRLAQIHSGQHRALIARSAGHLISPARKTGVSVRSARSGRARL